MVVAGACTVIVTVDVHESVLPDLVVRARGFQGGWSRP
jgi:hypothetical protein